MSKIGLLSDIHGNIAALEAVLQKLDDEDCNEMLCLGDVVGYGARPEECIDALQQRNIPCLMGNHDQYVTLLMNDQLERLRDDIRESIRWTQDRLSMDHLKWLSNLPMRIDREEGFSLVHGAFGPKPWIYCANEKSLSYNFAHQDVQLGFCGHSHVPLIAREREEKAPSINFLRKGSIPDEKSVMVNVGSVGQPRDRDPRAACLTYDTDSRQAVLIRVPYDVEKTQQQIRDAGLPERFAARLPLGR